MAVSVRIRVNQGDHARALRRLDPKAVAFAEKEALNGAAFDAQRTAIKAVSKEMGISKEKLAKRGRKVRQRSRTGKFGTLPTKKATKRYLVATLEGYGRPFNLTRWNAQEIRAGRTARTRAERRSKQAGDYTSLKTRKQVRRRGKRRGVVLGVTHDAWGQQQFAEGLFILRVAGRPVVKRVNAGWASKRGDIDGAWGPGLTHVIQYPHITKRLYKIVGRTFPIRFRERLRYAFSSASHIR